jgi:hypothetical protein
MMKKNIRLERQILQYLDGVISAIRMLRSNAEDQQHCPYRLGSCTGDTLASGVTVPVSGTTTMRQILLHYSPQKSFISS